MLTLYMYSMLLPLQNTKTHISELFLVQVHVLQFSVEVLACLQLSSEEAGLRMTLSVFLSPLQECGWLPIQTLAERVE